MGANEIYGVPATSPVERWNSIEVGEDLGSYEYVLTPAMIAEYRRVVGDPEAAYPTVAARHCLHLYGLAHPDGPKLMNVGHECEYYRPPDPGATITVTGRIIDKYERRGLHYVIVETTATDDAGHPVELSRLIGLTERHPELAHAAA